MNLPHFNSTYRKFTKRDTLGLQSLSSTIQGKICPIVNAVTPHPFYWAFLVWNYYHFYSLPENKNKLDKEFDETFVKRNDFYFVLSNFLNSNNMDGIAGQTKVKNEFEDKRESPVFEFYPKYYKSHFGGMQYYNFGCFKAGFVVEDLTKININGNSNGAKLTRAFDEVIKNTTVYKEYISQNKLLENVEKDALIELGKCLTLKMDNMDEVKKILYSALFPKDYYQGFPNLLTSVEEYIKLLIEYGFIEKDGPFDRQIAKRLLYGDAEPAIFSKAKLTKHQIIEAIRWELVIANQYYVSCMEMLWQYLLSILFVPVTQEEWITNAIDSSNDLSLDEPLSSYDKVLSFDEMENAVTNNLGKDTLSSVLSVLMSIVNRFKKETKKFDYLKIGDKMEFCVFSLINKINGGVFKNVRELFEYLLKVHVIDNHERVAIEKRYQGRDGFLFEKVDNLYRSRGMNITISSPSLRIVNVFSVLKELGEL